MNPYVQDILQNNSPGLFITVKVMIEKKKKYKLQTMYFLKMLVWSQEGTKERLRQKQGLLYI